MFILSLCKWLPWAQRSYGALGHLAVSSQAFAVMLSMDNVVIFPVQYVANVSHVIKAQMNSAMLIFTLPAVNSGIVAICRQSNQFICQKRPATPSLSLFLWSKVNTPAIPHEEDASQANVALFVGKLPNM